MVTIKVIIEIKTTLSPQIEYNNKCINNINEKYEQERFWCNTGKT